MQRLYTCLFLILAAVGMQAQDIHWTQFNMSPLMLNPAMAGNFHGTARLSGIARTQSNSIADEAFLTYGASVDAPIIKGLRENDWVGIGLSLAADKAGQLAMGIQSQSVSGSYHYALNKKATSYLTLGIQMESYGRKIGDPQAAELRDQTVMLPNTTDFKKATGYVGGLMYTTTMSKRTKLRVGGKVARLGKVNVGVGNGGSYEVPSRITIHGDLDHQVGPRTKITPAVLYETYGSASAFVAQAKGKYLINQKKDMDFTAGLGYRFGDALEVLLGMGIGDLEVGFAYDLPVSGQASEAIPLGGLEVAVNYILKIYKEPKVDPVIFCPRF